MLAHGAGLAAWRNPQGLWWEGFEVLQFVVDAHLMDAAVEATQRPVCALAQGREARGGGDACGRGTGTAALRPTPVHSAQTSHQSKNGLFTCS